MRASKRMLHPYSKHRYYISCAFQLCVPLRTYDAIQEGPEFNTLRKMKVMHGFVHDTMTSIRLTWCMAQHKEMTDNTMASLDSAYAWLHTAHRHPYLHDRKTGIEKHEFYT